MKLHYRSLGKGPPLIVLHGLLGSLDNWQALARRFAMQFQVFAVDQRNHGQSPHSDHVGYDAMAGDLHEFMHTHELARTHVLGHSMGGKVAMQFALHHPDSVEKLVVADVSPRAYPPHHVRALEALMALDLHAFDRREQLDAELAKSVDDTEVRQFLLKNVGRDAAGGFRWKANVRGLWENYEALTVAVTSDAPFPKPALFVRGERSRYVGESDFGLIRRLFPCAEFCMIAGAGHWVHADAPEEFARNVLEFLRD